MCCSSSVKGHRIGHSHLNSRIEGSEGKLSIYPGFSSKAARIAAIHPPCENPIIPSKGGDLTRKSCRYRRVSSNPSHISFINLNGALEETHADTGCDLH